MSIKRLLPPFLFVLIVCLAISLLAACKPSPPPATSTPTVIPSPTPIPLDEWVKEGDALLLRSDLAGAEVAYKRVITAQADYSAAYIGLSRVYRWLPGREDDALAQAQKAVELAPDSAAAQAALAAAQINQDTPEEAAAAAEKAAKLDEKSAFAQAVLARAYLLDRQYDAARKAAEQAVTLDSQSAEAYYALSKFYNTTADFSRARAALEQVIALEPNFAPWHVSMGDFWVESEQYDQATASYNKALELAPDYVPAVLGLAYVGLRHKDYTEADTRIQRAVELAPHAADVYVTWGYMYLQQEEYDKALSQFEQALTEDADNWYAQEIIGEVHLQRQECDRASSQYQDLMDAEPRFADGQIGMGFVRICEGDATKSFEYFRKAATLEPYNPSAQVGLGTAYTLQGRWDEAVSAYVQALRLSATGSQIHSYLGQTYSMQGDVDSAKAEYLVTLRLDPNSTEAHLGLGYIFLAADKQDDAQLHAKQVLALQENNRKAQWILGASLITQGKAEEGAEIMKKVIEEESENATAHYYLGLAYRDLKKYSQAKKELETYQALNPQNEDQRIGYLVQSLAQGYRLDEDKGLADLKKLLEQVVGKTFNVRVEQVDGKRTLVVSTSVPDSKELMSQAGTVAAGAAYFLPRLDPPVENGLLARFEKGGQAAFTVRASLSDLKKYIDGLASGQQFVGKLQFSREVASDKGLASISEIKMNLSETRKLDAKGTVSYKLLAPEEMQDQMAAGSSEESKQEMQAGEAFLSLLGVITPGLNLSDTLHDLYAEQVAGLYDPETKTLYVRQGKEQTASDQTVLAHEYAHALQDQNFGLEKLTGNCSNADQCRAFRALIEGDASLASYLYADTYIPMIDQLEFTSKSAGVESQALDATPSYITGIFLFPYEGGLTFVSALYDSGEWAAVDKAYQSPPQSTEQILHPERYREGDKPVTVALPSLGVAQANWREAESDVMGELELRLAWAKDMGPGAATKAAEGWAGDKYALLQQDPKGPYVLMMRTYWDDQDEADEYWSLFRVWMTHRSGYIEDVKNLVGEVSSHWWLSESGCVFAIQDGRYVMIVLGPDRETVEQVSAALTTP